MKKGKNPIVIILAIVGLGGCLCCGGVGALMFQGWRTVAAEKDKAFAWLDPALREISKDWSIDSARPYAGDGVLRVTDFPTYRKNYGAVKSLNTPYSFNMSADGGQLRIRLQFDGTFEKGPGTVRAVVVKENEKYRLARLSVDNDRSVSNVDVDWK